MTILIVGSGGREHALAWKISNDSSKPQIFCAPGNAGTASLGTNLAMAATDVDGIVAWCAANGPDLVVIGPEAPLCAGLADRLHADGIDVFGPSQAAAQLEGSKIFSKEVMDAAGVPTAKSASFTDCAKALSYIREQGAPIVVKADGLAAGKGVTVAMTVAEAEGAVRDALEKNVFGDAGKKVLIEEFLDGPEASILALIDGEHVVMLASAQDHKRVNDRDEGPNTGGMGAYSPAPVVTDDLWPFIREEVFNRTLSELRKRGITYKGVLYAGLMLTSKGPKVLEFNCRFGDPETQAILARWDGDILPAFFAVANGTLEEKLVQWKKEASVCVVMAAGGYPGRYKQGDEITGLDAANNVSGAVVFHAGTKLDNNRIVTAGGRVLGVTAIGATVRQAVDRAYEATAKIQFANAHYRRDIAWRALG
jgi:phosphoribosylamine--glycine ligase